MTDLLVSEIFGPTFQGEGRNVGMPAIFLRLAGCDLRCRWCDTRYAFDPQVWTHDNPGPKSMPLEYIQEQIILLASNPGITNLVVTGGEPLLQQDALWPLLREFKYSLGWHIEVETAGTKRPRLGDSVSLHSVGLKLANSGIPASSRIYPEILREFKELAAARRAVFKVVVESVIDLKEAEDLAYEYGLRPMYVMPQGIGADALREMMRWLAPEAARRGLWVSPRLQIEVYGNVRGV